MGARRISRVTKQKNPIFRDAHLGRSLEGNWQERLLCNNGLCASILHLVSQLGGRVHRVGGARDAAGPDTAKVDDGDIDVVGGEDAEDVAFFPAKDVLEALAELDAALLDVAKGV